MRKIQKTLLLLVIIVTIFASNSIVAFADVAASRCVPFKNGLAEYNGGVYTYKFSYEDLEGEKLENAYEFMQSYQATLDNPDKKYFYTNQYTSDTDIGIVLVDEMKSSSHLFSTSNPHYGYYLHYKGYSYSIRPSAAISDGTTCVLNVTGSYSQTSWDTAMGAHTATMWTSRPGRYSKTGWNYYFPRGGYGYTHNVLTGVSQILFEETSGIDPTEHTITVRYNYTNGKQAAETVTQTIHCGDSYRIASPTIPGYTASRKVVAGTLTSSVGNAKDIDVEVIYYPQTSGGTGEGIVNVTIPSSVTLYIGGDNNNQTFTDEVSLNIQNDGSPITLDTVTFTPGNWSLIPDKSELGLNEKKLVIDFNLDGQVTSVTNEKNTVETGVRIESGQSLPYGFTYHYGTWTDDHTPEEAFTITMNYSVEGVNASEGTLVTGPEIREIIASYPEVKNIVITDAVAPVEADTKDITSEKNFFIVYWVDGETLTVSTQRPDTKVKANEDCSEMFQEIEGLESIDLSNLDTSATKNMNDMFSGLTLKKLDLSALNTKAVETSNNMLYKLSKLEEITFGTDFNIQSSTNLTKPSSMEIENASNKWYNTKNEGFEPEEIPAGVADTYSVFAKTAAIDIDKLNNNLTGIEGLEIGTKTKKDITKIFGEEEFTPIDISKDGSGLVNLVVKDNVAYVYGESSGNIDATNPFSYIIDPTNTTLKSVSIGEYLKGLEDISSMFEGCTNLEKVDLNKMDTSKVTIMDNAFSGCTNLTDVVVDHLDTSAVTSMTGTFKECSKLESLDVSGWDTKAVTESTDIFTNCNKLKEVYVGVNTTIHNKLPAQTSDNIPGADGKWYNSAGTAFNPGNLTLNTAQKWSAVTVVLGSMGTLGTNINGMTHLYIGTVTEPPEGSTTPIDVGTTKNGSVMLAKVGTSAYVYSPNGNFQVNPTGGVIGTGNCTYVEVGKYVKNTTLTRYWFLGNTEVNHVKLTDLDTTQVINMNSMFNGCTNLMKIELPVSKNKNIDLQMFLYNTAALEEIDLSIFDTSYVQNAANCFGYSKLSEIDLSTLDLGELEIAQYMFGDSKATSINLSGLKTNKLWDVKFMFQRMPNLQNIILDGWDVSNVTEAFHMFSGNSATSVDLSKLHFNSLTNAAGMFSSMANLTEVTLPKDTGKVVTFNGFFESDRSLATINGLDYLDTSSAEDFNYMFRGCSSLESIDVNKLDTSNVAATNSMFSGCSGLKDIQIDSIDVSKVTDMRRMFYYCASLEKLNLSGWANTAVTSDACGSIFNLDYKLKEIEIGENTRYIQNKLLELNGTQLPGANGKWYSKTTGREYAVNQIPTGVHDTYIAIAPFGNLDLAKLKANLGDANKLEVGTLEALPEGGSEPVDVSTEQVGFIKLSIKDGTAYVVGLGEEPGAIKVQSLSQMLTSSQSNIKSVILGEYIKGLTAFNNLLLNCNQIEEVDISKLDLSNVTSANSIFKGCTSLKKVNISNPTTTNITDFSNVLSGTGIESLSDVNMEKLDMSACTDMQYFLSDCNQLETVRFPVLNTSKVTNLQYLLKGCTNLREANLNGLDTSAVTYVNYWMDGCINLVNVDISKLDFTKLTGDAYAFRNCTKLNSISVGAKTKLLTRTLPTPSATYIPGADGTWHTATGEAFTPAQIPYNKAETYYAVVPDAGSMDGDKLRDNLGDATELYLGVYKSGEIDGITTDNTLDISAAQDGSVKLTIVDGKAYVYGALTPKVIAPADLSHILGSGDSISLVKVGQYFIDAVNTDEMFDGYTNLTTLDVADFDTSKVTSMNSMFRNLENISRLDLGNFDTKNVSSSTEIFDGCVRLGEVTVGKNTTIQTRLPIPSTEYFEGSTGVWYSESGAEYLPENIPLNKADSYFVILDFGTFDKDRYTNALKALQKKSVVMDNIYIGTLTSPLEGGTDPIDISVEQDGSVLLSVKDKNVYVYGTKSRGALKIEPSWACLSGDYYTNKKLLKAGSRIVGLTDCTYLFNQCWSEVVDISELNTSNVTTMESMFQQTHAKQIILDDGEHHIDVSNVKSMSRMFFMAESLSGTFVWPESVDTSKVENFSSMFDSCSALSSLDIKNINVDGAIDLGRMISSCNSLTTIDVSHFNTSNATNLVGMFSYNPKLTSVKSNLDFKSATSAKGMFSNCSALKTLDLTGWKNTQNIKNIDQMFYYCTAIQNFNTSTINTTGWDTSNVVSTHGTFGYCSNMVTCDISNWNLPNLKHIGEMFLHNEKLTTLNVSGVSLAHLGEADEAIDTYWESLGGSVFWGCDNLNKITLGENINNGQKRFGPGQATKVWQNQDTGRLILPARACEDDLLEPGTWVKLPESTKIVSFYNGDDDDPINSLVKREIVTTSTVPSSMYPPAQSSTGYWGSLITVEGNSIEVYGDFRAFWIEPAAVSSIRMTDTLGDKEELCPYEYRGYLKSVKSIIFYNSDFEVVKSHQRLEDNTEPQYPEALTPTGHWGEPIEDEFGDIHIIWEESSNQIIFMGPDGNIVAQYPAILDSGIESIYPDSITETGHWGEPIEDENGNFIITWEEPEVTKIHLRFYDQNKKLLKEVEIDAEADITEYCPEPISETGEWGEPIEVEAGDIEVYWVEIKEIPDEETPLAPPTVVTPDEEIQDGDASDGDASDGDVSDGDVSDGDASDGEAPDEDVSDGDASDGEAPDEDVSDGDTSNSDESGVRDDSKDELPDENTSGGDITNDETLDEDEGEVTDTEDTSNEDTSDTLDGSQDEDEVVDNTDTQETDESSLDTIEDETQGDDRDTEGMSTEDTQENEAAES